MANASTGLQLRSTVKKDGTLELSLASVPTPEPKPEEVIVRVDASPINPSDQGLLFGGLLIRRHGPPGNGFVLPSHFSLPSLPKH